MANGRHFQVSLVVFLCLMCVPALYAQFAEPNVNMVSGQQWPGGDPFLRQQNEPSIAISTRNPLHLLAGANDYRSVDIPFNAAPRPDQEETGDAWLGVFKSKDGGNRWQSTLLDGYPQQANSTSPLKGFQAGADPVVRAGGNGMFYYAGLVLNRGDNPLSGAFVARFIDNNNLESGDPIAYLDTKLIAKGSAGQFVDKPWILVTPANNGTQCTVSGQTFPAQNVYLAYTLLVGGDVNIRTKIYIAKSADCGATWGAPTKLSESYLVNQGVALAVDPSNSNNVYVIWRQFKDTNEADAIIFARSSDAGGTFSKGAVVRSITPFEQKTSATSIRSNAYPALAVDDAGRLHVAWSERDGNGDGRIVLITSTDGGSTWSTKRQVDAATDRGHQFMPAMTFAAGKLTIVWYDLRESHTVGTYKKSVAHPGFYDETRLAVGNLAMGPFYDPAAVFWNFLADQSPTATKLARRHTLEVRLAEFDPASPIQSGSVRASRYRFGTAIWTTVSDTSILHDLQINPPNLPMFRQGTVPFFGDYIDVQAYQNGPLGSTSTAPLSRVRHIVWTDNRDVRAPLGQPPDWTKYTPVKSPALGTQSIFDPLQTPPDCTTDALGNAQFAASRNQNIYTTRITDGLFAGAPGNAKPLGRIQRAFAVFVQNARKSVAYYRLTIPAQPAGGSASFLQFSSLTTLDLAIPPRSIATRTVFVTNASYAKVDVNVREIGAVGGNELADGLASAVTINPDPANPDIGTPDIGTPDIGTTEVFNPDIGTPDIGTPDIGTPDIGTPDIGTPDIGTPDIGTPDIGTPDIGTPDIGTPDIGTPGISNPDIGTPDIGTSDIQNGSATDTIWTAKNTGNTTGGFTVRLLKTGDFPPGVKSQLLLYKVYDTPVARGCNLSVEHNRQIIASISNPDLSTLQQILNLANSGITDPSVKNPTMWLAPKETGKIAIRLVDPYHKGLVLDAAKYVAPVVVAQAVNTADLANPDHQPRMSLLITTTQVDGAVVGQMYSMKFDVTGGTPPYTWTSPGFTIDSTGLLEGTFASAGTAPIVVSVADSATPPNTASRSFNVSVASPLAFNFASVAPGMLGGPQMQTLTTAGGTPPVQFSIINGSLPAGLTLSAAGTLSGAPTSAGTFAFALHATDSASPAQSVTASYQIVIAAPPPGCSPAVSLLLDNWNALPVGNNGAPPTVPGNFPSPAPTYYCLDSVATFHWNGGAGAAPGTLGLSEFSNQGGFRTIGPWQSVSASGPDGEPNVSWLARPPAGTPVVLSSWNSYTLLDSDHATWSQNATSGGLGFAKVYVRSYAQPRLQFVRFPTSTISGRAVVTIPIRQGSIDTDLIVGATDSAGAVLPGVTVTITQPAGACSNIVTAPSGFTATTDITGAAHFGPFIANQGCYGAVLTASSPGFADAVSNAFDVWGFGSFPRNIADRYTPASVRLNDGRILVTGGSINGLPTNTAEVYDPASNTWRAVGSMAYARTGHTATLLQDGSVLIAGGSNNTAPWPTAIEIFNPATETFAATGLNLATSRKGHAAVLKSTGTVLLIGGYGEGNLPRNAIETYSPSGGMSQLSGALTYTRWDHAAVALPDDRVLVFGGCLADVCRNVEMVDGETVAVVGSTLEVRSKLTATLLQDGTILLAGGYSFDANTAAVGSSTTEVYNVITNTSEYSAALAYQHAGHAAQRLSDGSVVIAGGEGTSSPGTFVPTSAVEVYYPSTQAGPATVMSFGNLFAPQYAAPRNVAVPLVTSPGRFIMMPSPTAGQVFYPRR